MTHSWTDARVKRMKELWKDGWSASEIAYRLGGVSRSAVIGKIHRLGIRRTGPSSTRNSRTKPTAKPVLRTGNGLISMNKVKARRKPKKCDRVKATEDPKHIDLMDLTNRTCRYPYVINGETTFCGQQTITGSVYCAYHHERCTRPPKKDEKE